MSVSSRLAFVLAFASVYSTFPAHAGPGPLVPEDPKEVFSGGASDRSRAALLLGISEQDLADARISDRTFVGLGITVTLAKGVDRASGNVHAGAFDAYGRRLDLAQLEAADAAIVAADPSFKIVPALRTRLASASPGESIEAAVWLKIDGSVLDRFAAERLRALDVKTATSAALKEAEAEIGIHARSRVAEVVSPFVASLAGSGVAVRYASTSAPVVLVIGDAERLAALTLRPEVDTIFDKGAMLADANADANGTHRIGSVHSHGVTGNGIRVAILEDNRIDPTNPFLNVSATFDPSVAFDSHVHGTAGCVQSSMAGRTGSAPDVELLSAGAASYFDSDVMAAGDWIATQDVDITNMSFGNCVSTMDVLDFYFDFQSRSHNDSYVAAAGNQCSNGSLNVGSPAKAYNVIACGNFADNENRDWTDDSMNSSSCFVNPTTLLNKPNVAANGTSVDTLDNTAPSYTQNASGTSFSAPHTSGNLACAMQVNTVPKAYPQAAMAMMMATAWHNIEGATPYSTVDGAGGIDGWAAYRCALNGQVEGATFVAADFDANDQHVENIWLEADQVARVCFAYSSEAYSLGIPTIPIYLSFLGVDFDIAILEGPNQKTGPVLAASSSTTDNFEIVEFTPPVTGFYSVRIDHNGTFAPSVPEPWGLAWSQEGDKEPITIMQRAISGDLVDLAMPHPGHKSSFDVVAPGFPNRLFAVVPSGTAGHTPFVGGVLPIDFDFFTFTWLALLGNPGSPWQGTVGALDSNGKAVAITSLMLPPIPSLVGQEFHHVPVILEQVEGEIDVVAVGEDLSFVTHTKPHADGLTAGESIPQALPFAFPFFGESYTSCFVNANGTITFGAANADPTPSVSELLAGPPRIAIQWGQMPPDQVVEVSHAAASEPELEEISFVFHSYMPGQPVYGNIVRVTLRATGVVVIEYGPKPEFEGIVGVSPGLGISNATPIDFSKSGGHLGVTHDATFEYWASSSAFDLGPQVHLDAGGNPFAHWTTLRFQPVGDAFRVEIEGVTEPAVLSGSNGG